MVPIEALKHQPSRPVHVGNLVLGADNPVRVQSMCNTKTRDIPSTVAQILSLEQEGCEIIRVAVPNMEDALALGKIKDQIHIPLVSDIHYDHRLALEAIRQGVDKIRINPGNIGSETKVKEVVAACKDRGVPIRIGVNVGSIEKDLQEKYGPTPEAAVESCLRHVHILERNGFENTLLSIKFNDVQQVLEGYRRLAEKVRYPLHLGVTHAGTSFMGTIKNTLGIGILLQEGIGATLRVSLTAELQEEVRVGWAILKALGLRRRGIDFISCPTCGRTEIDLMGLAQKVEAALPQTDKPLCVAVMGCPVNGIEEARQADIGVAGGKDKGVIFKHGQRLRTVPEEDILPTLLAEINKLTNDRATTT